MTREEPELPPYFRNKVAFSYGTFRRSPAEIEVQSKIQHNRETPIFFEVISFDNGPLPFNSIAFLPPGETAVLKMQDVAMHRFRSQTETALSESDVNVFARVVLDDGGRRYVPLCLMEIPDRNWLTLVYEVDENADDTTLRVDGLLVAGRLECVSYVLLRHREASGAWTVAPEEECMYYGNNTLDALKCQDAVDSAEAVSHIEPPQPESETKNLPLSHLKRYTDAATCKTLFELREASIDPGREEQLVQYLVGHLQEFLKEDVDLCECANLMDLFMECYKHTKFIFSDKIPLNEVIVPVVEKCVKNLCFDAENLYFGLLQVLVRDCDVAHRLMFDMNFGKQLVGKLVAPENYRWIERGYMLDLLVEIVSHGKCMRNFLQGDPGGKIDSLSDTLLLGAAKLRRFSLFNMKTRMEALGQRVELFLALSRVEQLFQSLGPKLRADDDAPAYEHLNTLLQSFNEAVEMIQIHHTGKVKNSMLRDIHEVRQYTVSYLLETTMHIVLTQLMGSLLSHLQRFPVAPMYIDVMLERPLWFVAQYTNLIDFGACLLYMTDICDFVNGMALNNALQSGMYASSHAIYCKSRCQSMAIQTIVLKMASALLGKRSCPQIVSALHRICTEYPCGYRVIPTILAEQSMVQTVLQMTTSAITDITPSGAGTGGHRENMELWQLFEIVCNALLKDESGMLLYFMGNQLLTPLGTFLDMFVPEGAPVADLELQPLCDLRNNLVRLFKSSALMGPAKGGRLFDDVDVYLRDLLASAGVELHPNTLKQSMSKLSHMDAMGLVGQKLNNSVFLTDTTSSKTIPRSMVSEQLSTVYSVSAETVEMGDVHWTPSERYSARVTDLGVPADKAGHYNSCRLYVAPPERLPEFVHYGVRLLSFASTMDQYVTVFADLLRQRENAETLLRLWVHAVASISPDIDTVFNVEMGAFKSLVGYEWFFSSEDAIPLVTNIAQVVYSSLHHLSCDRHCHEETDEHRKVTGAPVRYINDDMLTLVVLSVNGVMINQRWAFDGRLGRTSRKCLKWLCKLMSYWYLRYEKSQGYLMNKLMGWYTTLPCMADGAALLIASCGPVINPKCDVQACLRVLEDEDNEAWSGRRRTRVLFEGREYTVALSSREVKLGCDIPNSAFWGLIRRIESLKVPVFAEFMCAVATRCYSANPCTVVLASEIAHFLIVNGAPVMVFLSAVADRCLDECLKAGADASRSSNASGKAYRLLTFWSLVAKALVSNEEAGPTAVFRVNNWIMDLFSRYTKGCKVMTEGCCRVLFDGYLHLFSCHNKLWEGHHAALTRDPEFHNYMKHINGAVWWICNTLNGCKAKDAETVSTDEASQNTLKTVDFVSDGRSDSAICLSWEVILAGFAALKHAFKIPFTALNILYTVLSGPMELIVQIINKQIDSEIIKVTPSTTLWLNGIIRQLCDTLTQHGGSEEANGGKNSNAPLQLLIMQLLHDICASIHQTGPAQDVFICSLVYGTTHAADHDMLMTEDKSGEGPTESSQQQEDIYSDIVDSSKSRVPRKVVTSTSSQNAANGSVFKNVTDALEAFRDRVAPEIAPGESQNVQGISLSSQIANVLLLLNAFKSLSSVIAKDAMERTPPKSLPGYIFLKVPSYTPLFRHSLGDAWSTDGRGPSSTRSILTRVVRMTKCEDWAANTCFVNQSVPSPLSTDDRRQMRWMSRCFMFNGSPESVEMWKAVRYLATAKLLFADEMMQYAPMKTKRMERPLTGEGMRYIRSVSTRAPSKHVDAYESEKAGVAADDDGAFTQENIEKAVAQLNGVITSQTWLDFDNDLVTNGLNLRSILVNPGLLKDYSARATFLNALSRHVLIKELLISEKKRIADLIYREIAQRDVRWVNFFDLEGRKVVYRKYAGIVISIYTDREDNTLAYHELIHLIVEILDDFYGNVHELDVVCNFNTLHSLLNELILAGELLETSKQSVLERMKATYKLN
ncbi:clathrin-coat assembly protein [Babesia ovata]|uniref:Clathrin-coat assembly protein n=1 Tax=Babesia ovata TaxID=189622 RepID=A0A2H6K7X1_9APIC|nr:clathrin-coat assembly protein [Babesia ovata]GBE59091.1 clathrin-coat assembly protein [Babesia ovata]